MAYGTLCKHCGLQETEHDEKGDLAPAQLSRVNRCPGFVSRDPDTEISGALEELTRYGGFAPVLSPNVFARLPFEARGPQFITL